MKRLSPIKDIKSQNKIIKLLETKADNRCYIASNCNINLVQELLHHSSPSITRRYLCLDEEDFRSVIDL